VTTFKKLLLVPMLALAAWAISVPAQAQGASVTGTLTVTATVPKSCRFTSGNDTKTMAFGSVDPWAVTTEVTAQATFVAQCSIGTTVKAGLNAGNNVSTGTRRMAGLTTTTQYLIYTLYSNSTRTTTWPIATGCADTGNLVTPDTVTNPLTSSGTFNLNVYGKVLNADAQSISAQDYSDTVTVYLCAL